MKNKKNKHNKKRNTAFLYEILVREITRSIVNEDREKEQIALGICKDFFRKGSTLRGEKDIYDSLLSLGDVDDSVAAKIMSEAKEDFGRIDKKEIFNEQTKVVSRINKSLSTDTFGLFVQNYKDLATIAQILNKELPVKERVLLENKFLTSKKEDARKEMEPTDSLVYKMFVENFNKKYGSLLEEQKDLVTRHALSFSDNGFSLKVFLNEELTRLKKVMVEARESEHIKDDENMKTKLHEIYSILESFKEKEEIDQQSVSKLLEIQELARELEENESNAD